MLKQSKKFLSLLLTFVMLFSMVPANALAVENEQDAVGLTVSGIVLADGTEEPVANHPVSIYKGDDNENALQQTATNESGAFAFSGIQPGSYLVRAEKTGAVEAVGTIVTVTDKDVTDVKLTVKPVKDETTEGSSSEESSSSQNNTESSEISDPSSQENTESSEVPGSSSSEPESSENVQIEPFALNNRINGTIWYDENGDGVKDATESVVSGYTVSLYDAADLNTPLKTTTTSSAGNYSFASLEDGDYIVGVAPGYPGTVNSANYLPPSVGITGDNKFALNTTTGIAYTDPITLSGAMTVNNMSAGMRRVKEYKIDINTGDVTDGDGVPATAAGVTYDSTYNRLSFGTGIEPQTMYTVWSSDTSSLARQIIVNNGISVKMTLQNLNLSQKAPGANGGPFQLFGTAKADVTIKGNNTIEATGASFEYFVGAAVHVPSTAALTIRGNGTLNATSRSIGAAIGGDGAYLNTGTNTAAGQAAGTINITGDVTVNANAYGSSNGTGGVTGSGAAIGGGGASNVINRGATGGDGGVVTIGGNAKVTLATQIGGAGIGGGYAVSEGSTTNNQGTAIGGNGGTVTIKDNATVKTAAYIAQAAGVGIGGGGATTIPCTGAGKTGIANGGSGGTIVITGNANVTIQNRAGAGIGGGQAGVDRNVGDSGLNISRGGDGGDITIDGNAKVQVISQSGSAAIGGGYAGGRYDVTGGTSMGSFGGNGGNINIGGQADVTAESWGLGACIGGGGAEIQNNKATGGNSGTITISGGNVRAVLCGSSPYIIDKNCCGAAIGGGGAIATAYNMSNQAAPGSVDTITISGGTVYADVSKTVNVRYNGNASGGFAAAAIGAGGGWSLDNYTNTTGGDAGIINITGGDVTANGSYGTAGIGWSFYNGAGTGGKITIDAPAKVRATTRAYETTAGTYTQTLAIHAGTIGGTAYVMNGYLVDPISPLVSNVAEQITLKTPTSDQTVPLPFYDTYKSYQVVAYTTDNAAATEYIFAHDHTGKTIGVVVRDSDNKPVTSTNGFITRTGQALKFIPFVPGELAAKNVAQTTADITTTGYDFVLSTSNSGKYEIATDEAFLNIVDTHNWTGFADAGNYSYTATGLTPNTLYYVRQTLLNELDISLVTETQFRTLPEISAWTVAGQSGTPTTAEIAGSFTAGDNGQEITGGRILYSTNANFTSYSTVTLTAADLDNTAKTFGRNITGLSPNTLYYFKVVLSNRTGTNPDILGGESESDVKTYRVGNDVTVNHVLESNGSDVVPSTNEYVTTATYTANKQTADTTLAPTRVVVEKDGTQIDEVFSSAGSPITQYILTLESAEYEITFYYAPDSDGDGVPDYDITEKYTLADKTTQKAGAETRNIPYGGTAALTGKKDIANYTYVGFIVDDGAIVNAPAVPSAPANVKANSTIYYIYQENAKFDVTVHHVYRDNNDVVTAETVQDVYEDTTYTATPKTGSGYTYVGFYTGAPDTRSQTIYNKSATPEIVGVNNSKKEITLVYGKDSNGNTKEDFTITRKWLLNGTTAIAGLPDATVDLDVGDSFNLPYTNGVNAADLVGYTYQGYILDSGSPVPNADPNFTVDVANGNRTVIYVLTKTEYSLTVRYVDRDGNTALSSDIVGITHGEAFTAAPKTISGKVYVGWYIGTDKPENSTINATGNTPHIPSVDAAHNGITITLVYGKDADNNNVEEFTVTRKWRLETSNNPIGIADDPGDLNVGDTFNLDHTAGVTPSDLVGYTYRGYTLDGGALQTGAEPNFTVSHDHEVIYVFVRTTYTITVKYETRGGTPLDADTTPSVTHGNSFTAVDPNNFFGYTLVDWKLDGAPQGNTTPTINPVTGAAVITLIYGQDANGDGKEDVTINIKHAVAPGGTTPVHDNNWIYVNILDTKS